MRSGNIRRRFTICVAGVVALWSAILVSCGKKEDQPGRTQQATTTAAPTQLPPPRALTEKEEVRAVAQFMWPHARKVDAADFRWAGCSDRTVGFDASRSCLEGILKEVEELRSKMPAKLKVQSACGIETEKAHRDFVDGRVAYLRDHLAWMDQNAATLKRAMSNKSLSSAWSAMSGKVKDSRPLDVVNEKYTKGLLIITQLPCMQSQLGCPSLGCNSGILNRMAGLPD
ncbi:hypothetical protein [Sorangium sp. So ce693]|uniref:hypothetical protein n=1 Tax=Sorangium sp. So ce693 TaxID=3133318 RepID=UPI003F5EC6A9